MYFDFEKHMERKWFVHCWHREQGHQEFLTMEGTVFNEPDPTNDQLNDYINTFAITSSSEDESSV